VYSKKIKLMRNTKKKNRKRLKYREKKCWLPEERSGGTDEIGFKRHILPAKINIM